MSSLYIAPWRSTFLSSTFGMDSNASSSERSSITVLWSRIRIHPDQLLFAKADLDLKIRKDPAPDLKLFRESAPLPANLALLKQTYFYRDICIFMDPFFLKVSFCKSIGTSKDKEKGKDNIKNAFSQSYPDLQ
jgi:hypothetical protein